MYSREYQAIDSGTNHQPGGRFLSSYAYFKSEENAEFRYPGIAEAPVANIRNVRDGASSSAAGSVHIVKKYTIKQSRHLPNWMWVILSHALGIRSRQFNMQKPWLSTMLFILTVTSAVALVASRSWIMVHTVFLSGINEKSLSHDALNDTLSIMVATFWCSLGVYANKLAYRLFRHASFKDGVRLHSKTIFKLNASIVVTVLCVMFIIINNVQARNEFNGDICVTADVDTAVCKLLYISRVVFSAFALVWNLMIALVLLSVCRTHTIGIRRFICDLENDAATYDQYYTQLYNGNSTLTLYNIFDEYIWVDEDDVDEAVGVIDMPISRNTSFTQSQVSGSYQAAYPWRAEGLSPIRESRESANSDENKTTLEDTEITFSYAGIGNESPPPPPSVNMSTIDRLISKPSADNDLPKTFPKYASSQAGSTKFRASPDLPALLSCDEILHRYWKVSCRLRLASSALQRWLVSFLSLCLTWIGVHIAYWLSHKATLLDVVQFIIPLLLMPTIGSAYAEVNNEGIRMLKFLCPTEKRFGMLSYLNSNPLQMVAFGFPITYSTVVTAVFALMIACTSRIILSELKMV